VKIENHRDSGVPPNTDIDNAIFGTFK